MGNRINKVLGYALKVKDHSTDMAIHEATEPFYDMPIKRFMAMVKKEKDEIVDFHKSAIKGADMFSNHEWTIQWFDDFLKHGGAWLPHESYKHCLHSPADILSIVAMGHREWFRYDDLIDYYENQYSSDVGECLGQYRSVRWLDRSCGIHPYVRMVRIRMPKAGIFNEGVSIDQYSTLEPALWESLMSAARHVRADGNLDGQARETIRHFEEDYRPVIPFAVTIPFWFIRQAFSDPMTAYNSLRPSLSTYWD